MNKPDPINMTLERHATTVAKVRAFCMQHVPAGQNFVVMIYDDEMSVDRKLSFISNANETDVRMICKAVGEQMNPGGIVS